MIEKIERKRGCTYRARIVLPDKVKMSKTFKRRTDAEKWERQMLYQMQAGLIHGNKLNHKLSFNKLVRLWYVNKIKATKTARTIKNYKSDVTVHLLGWLGNIQIREIQRSHADMLIQRMKGEGYSHRSVNKILIRLKQILNYAVEEQLLALNPLNRFPELKEPPKRDVYLTAKEIQQLLIANNQEWIYPLLVLAVNTGMRLGELSGLCWDRVNFEQGLIEVTRTQTREGLQETTKNHLKRIVPMNETVMGLLRDLMRQQRHPQYVLVNDRGKPFDVNHVSQRSYKQALKRAKVSNVRFHDLRHTFASHFMMNGGNIYDLQKILGHTEMEMTMRYAHLSPTHLREAIRIVEFNDSESESPQKVHGQELTYKNPMISIV